MSLRSFFRSVFGGLSCSPGRDDADDKRQARRSSPPRVALSFSEDPEYWQKWSKESMNGLTATKDRRRSSVRQAGPVAPARLSSTAVRGSAYTPSARTYTSMLPKVAQSARIAQPTGREIPRGQAPGRTQARARQGAYTGPRSQDAATQQTAPRVTFDNAKRRSAVDSRQPAVNARQLAVNNRPKARAPKPLNQRTVILLSSNPTQRSEPPQVAQITPRAQASSHHGRLPQPSTRMKPMAETKASNKPMSRPSSYVARATSAASKPPSRPSSGATLNLHGQPHVQRNSSASTRSVGVRTSTTFESMSREAICEVVDGIGEIFAHIPYAVCGHAAMVYYGNTLHTPDHVSIVCPMSSLDALIGWAQARALGICARFSKAFTYTTADGVERCVRVLGYVKFDRLRRVRLGPSLASVLTLPVLADSMACDYVVAQREDDHRGMVQRARDICWLMRRIVEVGGEEQRLTVESAGFFGRLDFLEPFSLAYERAVPLMERAGLDLASIPGFNPPALIMPAMPEPRRIGEVKVRARRHRPATHADGSAVGTIAAVPDGTTKGEAQRYREAVAVARAGKAQARQSRETIGLFRLVRFARAVVRFQRMGDIFRTKQARSACPPLVINRVKTTAKGTPYTHRKSATALKGAAASKIPRYASGGQTLRRTCYGTSTPTAHQSVDACSERRARTWDGEMDLVLGENIVFCQ
ncbi:26S proteasome regulatory subunit rpn11 [Tolypocladium capitatum]|uniref:26S proteasome regulatory subunit rpn11 n=1 Tax=Tolypocladium capitatum TaxID=45235 RepID=A0A2K3Q8S2_9HYPO|nr:26S proteasome regulatory subunit rpn11 [Tolypocladium capitatum]